MSKQPSGHLLKAGDRVRIPGEDLHGVVTEVGRHDIEVRVDADGRTEHRRYSHEALVLEPTMAEASTYVDR